MRLTWRVAALLAVLVPPVAAAAAPARLELQPHDHVVVVGNTLAERMQYFGNFETLLHARFPQHELSVRNLGWPAGGD
jgi:hypothetical protein